MNIYLNKRSIPWTELTVDNNDIKLTEDIDPKDYEVYGLMFLNLAREFYKKNNLDDADIIIQYHQMIGCFNTEEKDKLIQYLRYN